MSSLKLPKSRSYLIASISGFILIGIETYSFIEAYKSTDNFEIFLRGLMLTLFILYTITYTVLYLKQKRL